jgi:hypothetical protein
LGKQELYPLPVGSAAEARNAKFEFARAGEKAVVGVL